MVYLEAPGFMELLGTGLGSLVSGIFQERSLWSKAVGERSEERRVGKECKA